MFIEIMLANIFKVCLFIAFFIFDIIFLDIPAKDAAIAVGGAFTGAMVLGYIKREKNWIERIIKTICSAAAALFIAPAFLQYYEITKSAYVGLVFFTVSIMSLFILRALINLTEKNAATVIKQVFVRVFNLKVTEERIKDRKIHITKEGK